MDYAKRVIKWIEADEYRMSALKLASSLGLHDWCLAAGFVRNLIWDHLHGATATTPLNDIDLIYHSTEDLAQATDLVYERKLIGLSTHPWSVKNQARMHERNADQPYRSCADAMTFWVEVETAVGAYYSLTDGVKLLTPFGLQANFSSTITMNKKRPKPEAFVNRIATKHWIKQWPKLEIIY